MRACQVGAIEIPARQVGIIKDRARKIGVFQGHAVHALIGQIALRTRPRRGMDTRINANLSAGGHSKACNH